MPLIIKNYDPEIADNPNHILGLVDILLENVDYVESITDIIGLKDNPLLKDSVNDTHCWGLGELIWYGYDVGVSEWETGFFEERAIGDYRTLQYTLFDILGLMDSSEYVYIITDSEIVCWNPYVIWNKDYEYVSDPFDLDLSVPVIDKIGLIDIVTHFIDLDSSETDCWEYSYQWNNSYIFS